MAIGMNKIKVIALAALAGADQPADQLFLTLRIGVAGVIWGTVLTTLFSNLLVPGIYVFRVLRSGWRPPWRTLGAPWPAPPRWWRRPGSSAWPSRRTHAARPFC